MIVEGFFFGDYWIDCVVLFKWCVDGLVVIFFDDVCGFVLEIMSFWILCENGCCFVGYLVD